MEWLEDDRTGTAGQALHPLREIVDRDRRAGVADVEALTDRARVLECQEGAVDHVVDVAPRPDLRAIPVDREVASRERGFDERANRAATDLARPEDVERPHRGRRQAKLGVIRVGHVLARELGHGVGPACLADRADRRHMRLVHVERVLAEHLARGEIDEPFERVLRAQRSLEDVVGPDHVDPHRPDGALEDRVHACDSGAVDDVRRACENLRELMRVEHVALHEAEVRMVAERRAAERVAMEVVDRNDLVLVDEALCERRADEACAAGHDDALARQSHAGESTSRPISGRSAAMTRQRRSRRAP